MTKLRSSEILLEYKILDLSFLKKDTLNNKGQIDQLVHSVTNEPIELRGDTPLFFVLPLFAKLKQVANELIYRSDSRKLGILIFSLMEEGTYIRPHTVGNPIQWTDNELKKFDKLQKKDTQKDLMFDLSDMWQKSIEISTEDTLKCFLAMLYSVSPYKEQVVLHGVCPISPALMVLNWFMLGCGSIFYEKIRLK